MRNHHSDRPTQAGEEESYRIPAQPELVGVGVLVGPVLDSEAGSSPTVAAEVKMREVVPEVVESPHYPSAVRMVEVRPALLVLVLGLVVVRVLVRSVAGAFQPLGWVVPRSVLGQVRKLGVPRSAALQA